MGRIVNFFASIVIVFGSKKLSLG